MNKTINKLTFIQDHKNAQGMITIDESTMELTQYSAKFLPIVCYEENIYVALKQDAPIDFIIGSSSLLHIGDSLGIQKEVYIADLKNGLQIKTLLNQENIINVMENKKGKEYEYPKEEQMAYINSKIKNNMKPRMISFVAKNMIIEVFDNNSFDIIGLTTIE